MADNLRSSEVKPSTNTAEGGVTYREPGVGEVPHGKERGEGGSYVG